MKMGCSQQQSSQPGTIVGITGGDLAEIGILAMIFLYVYQLLKKKRVENSKACVANNKDQVDGTIEEVSVSKESKDCATWSCFTNGSEETSEATGSDSNHENNANNSDVVVVEYGTEHHGKGRREESLVMVDGETELELEKLLKASAYILGSSEPSIVYKAVLEDRTALAVRRIGEGGAERMRELGFDLGKMRVEGKNGIL